MPIDQILRRSEELDDAIVQLLDIDRYQPFDGSARITLSVTAASLSIDHARALRLLVASGHLASAVPLMRLQFEATTRSTWLLFAASEDAIERAAAPLTVETEAAARKLPVASEMLKQLSKAPAPAAAAPTAMLGRFNDMQRHALNSFVHGGLHALRRHEDGYPVQMVRQLVECSNGLVTIGAMMLAILTGDQLLATRMNSVHLGFEDCLTPILPSY